MRMPPVTRPCVVVSLFALVALAIGVGLSPAALAGPEPSPVPKRWQLDAEFGPLRVATVQVPEVGPRAYFYLTYSVTNNSGEDLLFAPAFELSADTGSVRRSGRDVPVVVTRRLLDDLENPLMLDEISMTGTLLQGKENMKEGLVIWPAEELKLEHLTVYAAGFSGETATIEIPKAGSRDMAKFVLRKTAELTHWAGGEIDTSSSDPLPRIRKRWIMR